MSAKIIPFRTKRERRFAKLDAQPQQLALELRYGRPVPTIMCDPPWIKHRNQRETNAETVE